ncbi:hypothetical protein AB5Q63_004596 [Vibrio parahaemolyticus]|nr:hypothetical protein [Vibrio parahaemolyticus]EIU6756796.1 hypothetical protein [Vibrio parahaemolyticus]
MINIYLPYSDNGIRRYKPESQITDSIKGNVDSLVNESENVASTLELQTEFATPKEVTEALMAASVHQKQIVVQMVSSNPEDAIALSLAASIEAYGEQLENINAWTQGGSAVINACLDEMFENLIVRGGDGFSNCELEDLFQLVLISMMCNPDEYPGMDELLEDPEFVMHMGQILEFTGSGSHKAAGIFEGEGPSILKESYEYIYSSFEKKGIPAEGTFAYKCLSVIEKNGGLEELKNGMTYDPYMTDGEGWATNTILWGGVTAEAKYLSPANTLIVLGYAAGAGEATAEQWDEILSCNLETMDNILDVEDKFDNIYEYLMDKDPEHWAFQSDGSFDFLDSAGISQEYLNEVFGDFPPRELTEEEIEEVNRIGDQVKMLQQTLLYWLKICRDEQMAMAQNI